MFTGLVQALGTVTARIEESGGLRLFVDISGLAGSFQIGDSIALSGACCTLVAQKDGVAEFFLTPETLNCTWLGQAKVGEPINLEGALRAGEPLGGHIVQGHVDGVGQVTGAINPEAGGDLWAQIPKDLQKYLKDFDWTVYYLGKCLIAANTSSSCPMGQMIWNFV